MWKGHCVSKSPEGLHTSGFVKIRQQRSSEIRPAVAQGTEAHRESSECSEMREVREVEASLGKGGGMLTHVHVYVYDVVSFVQYNIISIHL